MEISNICYKAHNPNFTSSLRFYPNKIFTKYTGGDISTTTCMFRPDVDWDNLPKLMDDNFKDKEHVNVYSVACSDGSEPYTLAISLMENLPKDKCNKFFPIIASDKDAEIIDVAKSGRINLTYNDIDVLQKHVHTAHEYFKNKRPAVNVENDTYCGQSFVNSYEPVNKLKNAVSFHQSDILKQIYRIRDKGNSVVMCRNVTPYLSEHYINLLVEALKRQLKPGSLLITGQFDRYANFEDLILDDNGGMSYFEKIDKNIYRRKDIPSFKTLGAEPQFDTNRFYKF